MSASTMWRQRWWKLFVLLCIFSIDMDDIVFYFYSQRNKSKRHASCLCINITVDRVPWQRSCCEILRESCLLLQCRIVAISRGSKKVKDTPQTLAAKVKTWHDVIVAYLACIMLELNHSKCSTISK